jgi:hypothetical protein
MPSADRDPREVSDWAASGAVWLSGRPDGPPLVPPGRAATFVRESLALLGLNIPGLLGERAAYAGLSRNAPWSCGGAFQIVPTLDGWLGVSLARPSDHHLVDALVESSAEPNSWDALVAWAAETRGAEAEERLRLLGIPGGVVPSNPVNDRAGVETWDGGSSRTSERPLVVDLTSMWAGPLCAHLLGRLGARVVKVESLGRPDGARLGPRGFFDLLHQGHETRALDFQRDRGQLRELIASADLVLEASRPRALRQLGIVAEEVVSEGTSWLSITAHGRSSDAVGFGDDVAASAGLVIRSEKGPLLPAGDAIADPLTGVAAAVAGWDSLLSERAQLIDVSMRHVTAETLGGDCSAASPIEAEPGPEGSWRIDTGDGVVRVEPPRRRYQQ